MAQLLAELEQPVPPPEHVAPEQIASVAMSELAQDRLVDASLWLSVASYRYHQEALAAIVNGIGGERTLPANVRRSAYRELVEAEIDRYVEMGFQNEVRALEARAYGQNETERVLQQQLTTLGKTSEIERESLRDALWQLQPAPPVTSAPTRYPALAEAFRRRLLADARRERNDENPADYLARTPVPALQAEALKVVVRYFDPPLCGLLATGFPALRPMVVANLSAARPQTRANAAATLALAPSAETRAALEARLASETDPGVKLAIAYALAHHGVPEQAVSVTAALQSCQGRGCTLPVTLAAWLPRQILPDIRQSDVARIARGNEFEPRAHLFAAFLLRDIGRAKPLEEASVEALIVAARRRTHPEDKLVADPAYAALSGAEALTREAILARLASQPGQPSGPDQLFPGPLVARFSSVAEADDLPLLTRLMSRFGDKDGPEAGAIVAATLHISTGAARARLLGWLRYQRVRPQIVIGLAQRPDVQPRDLEAAVQVTDARAILLLKAVHKSADLTPTVINYLHNGTPADKWAAAQLAVFADAAQTKFDLQQLLLFRDRRYYPNDALIRHAAMKSLVQLALARTAKPAAPVPAAAL